MKVSDLQSIRIKIASPEEILEWSHGEVKKPETINYRTQRPEKEGLFCEKIFGPTKNYQCYCGKYKGVRFKGVVCDRCNVEVLNSQVRRERMGHIELAAPCSHIWFLRGIPSRIGLVLNISRRKVERVIYFVSYIIEEVDEKAKEGLLKEAKSEFDSKSKEISKSKVSKKEKEKQKEDLRERYQETKEEISSIEPLKVISEVEYRNLSLNYGEVFTAGTGAEAVLRIFEKINIKEKIKELKKELKESPSSQRKKIIRRLKFFQGIEDAGLDIKWMFLKVIPVLPPGLRPMVQLDGGRYASSDLNDLYRRVINRNNRLKHLIEISAPETIVRNEKRMLQEAVDSLLDNDMRKSQTTTASAGGRRLLKSLADTLKGKQGRFRKNLLGKRVDYSGRSVIASGPELKLNQCGIPKIMALELFRPFIIKRLLDEEHAYNIKGASSLIDDKRPEVFAALEEVVKDKYVLLNRAPTLHRLGVQAFRPVLIEGEAIKIHPLVCKAYNADFDGDQMGVYVPLSKEAQEEAGELMISSGNLLKPATGLPIVTPTLDVILGIYWLTTKKEKDDKKKVKAFGSPQEVISAYDLDKLKIQEPVKVYSQVKKKEKPELLETTCGRIIFNETLPENFHFVNEQIGSKKLSRLISELIREYDGDVVSETLDKIKDIGFEYATRSGITLGMNNFKVPEKKPEVIEKSEKEVDTVESQFNKGFLSEEEKDSRVVEIWQDAKSQIESLVKKSLSKEGPVFTIVDSGAKGGWAQPVQVCGMKGLVTSPAGRIIGLPIKNSFEEGFDVLEFFISSHGARKGTVDTALRTSASGYLTRRLADISHEVIVTEKDCGDKEGREIFREDAEEIDQDFALKIVGRVSLEEIKHPETNKVVAKKNEVINWNQAEEIESLKEIKKIKVRSPLSCKTTRGICQKCYGWEMGRNKMVELGAAVGIIAAQSIGEPGTQLTMRTFHLGGVAGGGDITRGLPRVEQIFELRKLKVEEGEVSISEGKVKDIDMEKGKILISPDTKTKKSKKKTKKAKKTADITYNIPEKADVFVKKGDKVGPGQALTSGPLDLKKLFKYSGIPATQRYITKEVQRVYVGEGINIHDKHIEIIARQMFSRMRVGKSGDSPWVPGQVITMAEFEEIQNKLEKEKGELPTAKPVLLGISRVSLASDSFLSAASFQETSRVLIRAAVEGREDKLHGLKENVIIGRIIPAGTGFRKDD